MRILLIISNLDGGGAQRVVLTLARGLRDRGYDIHILLMEHEIKYEIPPGITLHSLTPRGARMSSGWLGRRLLAVKLSRWYRNASMQGRFGLITANLPFTSEIVQLARIEPVWHHIHNSLSQEIEQLQSIRKARRRRKRYHQLFDKANVITVSNGAASDLRDQLGIYPAQQVTIYNPFDFDEIRRLANLPDSDLPSRPYVVHAGRFTRQKRHDILLDAFIRSQISHDLVLLTDDSSDLHKMIHDRGLHERVKVVGFRRNPFPWFRNAAALILSSDFEGFGNVIVEALACRTPVVSTDCPSGPAEILTGPLADNLCPLGNIGMLAQRLCCVVKNPPLLDQVDLSRFSLEQALDQFERLIGNRSR